MIEVAWLWRKYQPNSALAKWYKERAAGQSPLIRRIILVAQMGRIQRPLRLVTHRLLLQCMKKPSILKVRKIPDVIMESEMPAIY
jgi:hypothetical protein